MPWQTRLVSLLTRMLMGPFLWRDTQCATLSMRYSVDDTGCILFGGPDSLPRVVEGAEALAVLGVAQLLLALLRDALAGAAVGAAVDPAEREQVPHALLRRLH